MIDVEVGTKLYGFCNGFFGRDSYDDKIVEAVGPDWIVVRDSSTLPMLANFSGMDKETIDECLTEWQTDVW